MAANREIQKVRDGSSEELFAAECAINEVAYGASHYETESYVLRTPLRIERPEEVHKEKQRHE